MMRRKGGLFPALLAANGLLLAGCASAPKPVLVPTSEPFCRAVQTVCISKDDQLTEGTASQVEANNLGRAKVCKRQVACAPPKPTS
jgi:hypothetical protein